MKFKPLNDRILIKRDASEDKTEGGLVIPENAKLKSRRGTIIAVGPGPFLKDSDKRRAMVLEPGMRICWRGYSGEEVDIDDETYIMLREDEVEGIIEG